MERISSARDEWRAHPVTMGIEDDLRKARAALRAPRNAEGTRDYKTLTQNGPPGDRTPTPRATAHRRLDLREGFPYIFQGGAQIRDTRTRPRPTGQFQVADGLSQLILQAKRIPFFIS